LNRSPSMLKSSRSFFKLRGNRAGGARTSLPLWPYTKGAQMLIRKISSLFVAFAFMGAISLTAAPVSFAADATAPAAPAASAPAAAPVAPAAHAKKHMKKRHARHGCNHHSKYYRRHHRCYPKHHHYAKHHHHVRHHHKKKHHTNG